MFCIHCFPTVFAKEYSNYFDILADREHFCLSSNSDSNVCFNVAEDRLTNVAGCPRYTWDNKWAGYGAVNVSLENNFRDQL